MTRESILYIDVLQEGRIVVELLTFLFHKETPPKLEVVVLGRGFEKGP